LKVRKKGRCWLVLTCSCWQQQKKQGAAKDQKAGEDSTGGGGRTRSNSEADAIEVDPTQSQQNISRATGVDTRKTRSN